MEEGAAVSDTDAWIVDLREQQLRDLRQQLAAVIARAEKAEAPSNPALHAAVMVGLVALGWNADHIEIETAW